MIRDAIGSARWCIVSGAACWIVASLAGVPAVAAATAPGAAPARKVAAAALESATRYRYWTYWKSAAGGWDYATVGPEAVPPGGSVEGWRFEVSAESGARPPRRRPDFAAICRGTGAAAGRKRVAVVVDYGTTADAPPGEAPPARVRTFCAVAPRDATGYAVLGGEVSLRTASSGLVCALNGYPREGCGDAVGSSSGTAPSRRRAVPAAGKPSNNARSVAAPASDTASSSRGSPPYATIAGLIAAGALGVAAFRRARRRT